MATSHFESLSDEKELQDVIYCVWCNKQKLTQLIQLTCLHLACKACLQSKLEDPRPGTAFHCPECDMSNLIPDGGLDSFPDEPLQHKMNQVAAIFSNEKSNCNLCEEMNVVSPVVSVCITCKIKLCGSDAISHQEIANHIVVALQELVVEPNFSRMMNSMTNICQEHTSEKTYFCKTCQYQICLDCASCEHKEHNKESVAKLAFKYKEILTRKMKEMIIAKEKAKIKTQQFEEDLAVTPEEQNDQNMEMETKKELNRYIRQEIQDRIARERKKIKQFNTSEFYLKVFFKYSSDSDVIDKFSQILSNQNSLVSNQMRKGKLNSNINTTSGTERKIPCEWTLECKWADEWWRGVSMYKDGFLVVKHKNIKWLTMDGRCVQNIKCDELWDAWDVDVCEDEVYISDMKRRQVLVFDLDWNLSRTLLLPPSENGFNLFQKALGLAVDKTSRTVYVCSHSTKTIYKCGKDSLHFEPWIDHGLDSPNYTCTTPGDETVVSEIHSNRVIKYDSQGTILWIYGSRGTGKGQLIRPRGVCADPSGYVYIADEMNQRIVVVSEDGQHVTDIRLKRGTLFSCAVVYGNDRLIATTSRDFSNEMYIFKCLADESNISKEIPTTD